MSSVPTKHAAATANGHDDHSRSLSVSPDFADILSSRLSRRSLLKAAAGLVTQAVLPLASAGDSVQPRLSFSFSAVAKNLEDRVSVPEGYSAQVLYRFGDSIHPEVPAFRNDGQDTAASFLFRAGDCHDGMHYFGLDPAGGGKDLANSSRGLLCINHEYVTYNLYLHTQEEVSSVRLDHRVPEQIDKEVHAHGVSVIEVQQAEGHFSLNLHSLFHRRLTAATEMQLSGPVARHRLLRTAFSPEGTRTRGTLNNCANGYTPWGTYLTCEENWAAYFKRGEDQLPRSMLEQNALKRYGLTAPEGILGWANPDGGDRSGVGLYERWSVARRHADPAHDYAHAAHTFGWVVEIDPFDPSSTAVKRTALGRFAHEGAMLAQVRPGKPIVYYMGDDAPGEYCYKFVSAKNWDPADVTGGLRSGATYLDAGTLYAAVFDADGAGRWLELSLERIPESFAAYRFADQADVLVHARLAADALGATRMDRPEWAGVHPKTGEVYLTLTNNGQRGAHPAQPLDAANPRYYTDHKDGATLKGNVNGHILRIREDGGDSAATSFRWDVYLFGAEANAGADINLSGLSEENDFSSPDGLWFSQAVPGLMWLSTDDVAYTDVSHCMLLAALPGVCGDGAPNEVNNKAVPSHSGQDQVVNTQLGAPASPNNLRRFLVGPAQCEVTGVAETPDGRALFVNIQHPGEGGSHTQMTSHWPDGGAARPRSATVVITRDDGGVIAC